VSRRHVSNGSSLEQNYPNPFSRRTTICFTLKRSQRVSLRIFDPLGREVSRLLDGRMEPGTYTATWDAADRGGGIYYCRMTCEGSIETRSLELVR
jgi:hypothetical protein